MRAGRAGGALHGRQGRAGGRGSGSRDCGCDRDSRSSGTWARAREGEGVVRRLAVEGVAWRALLPGLSSGDEGTEGDDGVHLGIICRCNMFHTSLTVTFKIFPSRFEADIIAFVYPGTFTSFHGSLDGPKGRRIRSLA